MYSISPLHSCSYVKHAQAPRHSFYVVNALLLGDHVVSSSAFPRHSPLLLFSLCNVSTTSLQPEDAGNLSSSSFLSPSRSVATNNVIKLLLKCICWFDLSAVRYSVSLSIVDSIGACDNCNSYPSIKLLLLNLPSQAC